MQASWILAVAAVLHGLAAGPSFCDAIFAVATAASPTSGSLVPLPQSGNSGNGGENEPTSIATRLWNYATDVETNGSRAIERIAAAIGDSPSRLLSGIESMIRRFLSYVRSTFEAIWPFSPISNGTRRRRGMTSMEEMLSSLSSAIMHPIEFTENLLATTRDQALDEVEKIAMEGLRLFWNFLSTKGLPWTYSFLSQLEKSNNLPSTVRLLIDDFNMIYQMLQLLGYVGTPIGQR